MRYPDYVDEVIERLEAHGYEAYVVGGGLRDIMLGREPNDFDVTTSATPDEMLSVFSDMKTIPTGLKHGTLTVLAGGNAIEVTTYRVDGEYLDSRHPESVSFTADICEDLARRDFTVNAMAYNKKRGLVDPYGGQSDLESGILRAVGDPERRMNEDALRIMRALRFEAQLGFSVDEQTEKALAACREGLCDISGERKGVELLKLLVAPEPGSALLRMIRLGISPYIIGSYLPSGKLISMLSRITPTPEARLGMLLSECALDEARAILRGLKYSNALTDRALRIAAGACEQAPRDAVGARRCIIKYRDDVETVAEIRALLSGEDATALIAETRSAGLCESIAELACGGAELMSLGFEGREIGEVLSALFELVTLYPEKNCSDILLKEAEKIKSMKRNNING